MSTKKSLIELQKESFQELKAQIFENRRHESRSLSKYRKTYHEEVANYAEISSKADLLEDIRDAQIIYCGDFHTLKRSQYSAIKILKFLKEQNRQIYLGLELVPVALEHVANDFVEKRMSEQKFLEEIKYESIWGFPWSNYQPLFELSQQLSIPILGLNLAGGDFQSLNDRDQVAAERMVQCLEKQPDAVIFCLYGDLHIASSHIPKKVNKLLQKKKCNHVKTVQIFQNCEEIYWKLLELNQAHRIDVVKLKTNAYCILSSTPWIKWQSYQSWIDESSDLLEGKDEDTFGYDELPDFFHSILKFAQVIEGFLEEKIPTLEEFEVYTALDIKVADKINQYFKTLDHAPKKSIQKILEAEMIENRSILIPDQSIVYLLDFSQNRASEKASQWIATQLTDDFCIYGVHFSEKEIFYRLLLWEAIGYFGSKIINPKLKCDQYKDFEQLLEKSRRKKLKGIAKDEKIVADQIIKHRKFEQLKLEHKLGVRSLRKIFHLKPKLFFLCAQSLGQILGDRLYSKIMTDKISLQVVKKLFTCLTIQKSAEKTYWELATQIKIHQLTPMTSKDELF